MTWKPDICVYHGGCDDGFGAALVVRRKWGDGVQFVPGAYGGFEWPADLTGKNILFVDFSLKREPMRNLINGFNDHGPPASIVILDHHKTAEAELAWWTMPELTLTHEDIAPLLAEMTGPRCIAVFDMERSGARLAWDFCFPGEPVPPLIAHIEDRDLWRFAMVNTPAVSAALRTYPHDFDVWDNLDCNSLDRDGRSILRGHRKNVEAFIANRYWREVGGHRVPVVNVPYHYASDCADAILKAEPDAPFAASYFDRGDGKRQWSLRSRDDRLDVSEVAKAKGGGGHRNAAGFEEQVRFEIIQQEPAS